MTRSNNQPRLDPWADFVYRSSGVDHDLNQLEALEARQSKAIAGKESFHASHTYCAKHAAEAEKDLRSVRKSLANTKALLAKRRQRKQFLLRFLQRDNWARNMEVASILAESSSQVSPPSAMAASQPENGGSGPAGTTTGRNAIALAPMNSVKQASGAIIKLEKQ